jgi:Flp pilus assembly protein TadD
VRNAYGTLLTQTGQYEKAKKVFLETLEMTPESPVVINNLGNIDLLQGKYADAIVHYERAALLDEKDAQIHINLCKAQLQLGNKLKANEAFNKAVSLDASIADIYQELKKQIQ